MKIEKIAFERMIDEFQRILNFPPPTTSFSYAVKLTLMEYQSRRGYTQDRFGAYKCNQFEDNCLEYLTELRENGYAQWATGPQPNYEWLKDAGETHNPDN